MAKKDDRKKQKKRLKEQKRQAEVRRHQAVLRHLNKYPRIKIIPAGGDSALVSEIERLVNEFSFEDPECCPADIRQDYESIAKNGLIKHIRSTMKMERERVALLRRFSSVLDGQLTDIDFSLDNKTLAEQLIVCQFAALHCQVGTWLFEHLPKSFTEGSPARYFFKTELEDADIVVRFELLESVGESHNPLYLFPKRATVAMQGVTWEVGLYRHALEQLCDRLIQDIEASYHRWFELYSLFRGPALAFVPVTLSDGTEAVRIDRELFLATMNTSSDYDANYAKIILGLPMDHKFSSEDMMSTVVGYLPLQIKGKYARAKTFLLPGFSKTPEGELARRKAVTPAERVLLRSMSDECRSEDLESDTLKALSWCHRNGVPQVFSRSE